MKIIPSSRKNRYIAGVIILLAVIALIVWLVSWLSAPFSEIRDWYDLDAIGNNLSGSYILMNDLDSTTAGYEELASPTANEGEGWKPIGTRSAPFTGSFNGQGYEIRDMFINRPDEYEWYVGLFGAVGEGGIVQNIDVVNVIVTGGYDVGGLVGYNEGTVSDCYSTGSVTGRGGVGGLVGSNDGGTVSDSYSTASVTGYNAGGLVGDNGGAVSNSYSNGNVTGDKWVGGLVGSNNGTVSNSYSTGSLTGTWSVGGLVGSNDGGTVSNSHYNYDEVLINGENIITIGALFGGDFDQWLANDKFLDVNERLSQENGYYVVNNIADFKELLAFGQDDSLKFRLANDLDLATEPNFYIPYLAGEFDGNGHEISNLSFDFDFVCHVGLFGCLAPGGKVNQVGGENVNITGGSFIGGLVGINNEGTVSDCYSTGNVNGIQFVGGLVGENDRGTVSNSYSTGSLTGTWSVGGLVGQNGKYQHGGTVNDCYSTGSVTGSNWGVGGLVGTNAYGGTVSDCYSTGSVTGGDYAGGLVGYNSYGSNVSNSYSTGSVTGNDDVGGLVGYNHKATVSNSYSTGSVTGNSSVGGLVGYNNGGYYVGTVSNSFWDTETSGQATSDGGTGKNTTEMQDIATFSGAGWNIIAVAPGSTNTTHIWNIVDGVTYPFLNWQS